jgi:hypothetical protein
MNRKIVAGSKLNESEHKHADVKIPDSAPKKSLTGRVSGNMLGFPSGGRVSFP